MKFSKSYNSKVDYKKLLWNNKVLRFISVVTNSSYSQVMRRVRVLRRKIPMWIAQEGIKSLCSRIKESERSYLLTKKSKWFSLRYLSGPGISHTMTKILFSIHRNMYVEPVLDVTSINHTGMDVNGFLERYKMQFRKVLRNKRFRFPYHLLGDYKVLKGGFNTEFPKLGNLANDVTIDSNNRTGGMQFPLRISLSGGANGSPLISQKEDFAALKMYPNLWSSIKSLWTYWAYEPQENYDPTVIHEQPGYKPIVSKLYALQDRSCKTRVIAILDSYSQIALRPIHHMLDEILRKNPNDFTFNQFGGVQYLKGLDRELVSIDLKSATDTIPAQLSFAILQHIISKSKKKDLSDKEYFELIESCRITMTERPFTSVDGSQHYYKTGQPMGAYASFPLLAITNHFLCLLATELVGYQHVPYAIVGDDIVIGDRKVAYKYIELVKELGIPINYTKNVEGRKTFEFCRRIVVNGVLESVPSWNAFYSSICRVDPGPILKLLKEYDLEIPRYEILCKYFGPKRLRTMIALQGVIIPGGPSSVVIIPNEIKSHAERVITVEKLLTRQESPVTTDDPFISRLNYQTTIETLFRSKIKSGLKKKQPLWTIISQVRANTFYLGYLMTYHKRSSLNKAQRSYYSKEQITHSMRVRDLCMRFRAKWQQIITT